MGLQPSLRKWHSLPYTRIETVHTAMISKNSPKLSKEEVPEVLLEYWDLSKCLHNGTVAGGDHTIAKEIRIM